MSMPTFEFRHQLQRHGYNDDGYPQSICTKCKSVFLDELLDDDSIMTCSIPDEPASPMCSIGGCSMPAIQCIKGWTDNSCLPIQYYCVDHGFIIHNAMMAGLSIKVAEAIARGSR